MITTWDWRYRIFFDDTVREEVLRHIDTLSSDEAEVYQAIFDFYSNHFSVAMLMDYPDKIQIAENNSSRILWTPDELFIDIKDERTRSLIDYSRSVHVDVMPEYWKLIHTIYGKHTDRIIDTFMSVDTCPTAVDRGRKLEVDAYSSILNSVLASSKLREKFGEFTYEPYDLKIDNYEGFAEWWYRSISETGVDTLILHSNEDSLYENDMLYTILYEVYPGHAHFYRTLRNILQDHGALSLVEGWATYAEWNSISSEYSRSIRKSALMTLKDNYTLPIKDLPDAIIKRKMSLGYSRAEALRSVKYTTQYIGFTDAYYLGAVYFENTAGKLTNRMTREFFSLWD